MSTLIEENHDKLSQASSPKSNKGKRKKKGFQDESKFKMRRSFPGDHPKKTPLQLQLEEFFATAHENLMNLLSPKPKAKKVEKKNKNWNISADAREKLHGGLGKEGNRSKHQEVVGNQSRGEIEEMINELRDIGADILKLDFA